MALALDPCPANDGCKLVESQRSGLSPLCCHLLCFSSASGACPKLRQIRGKSKNCFLGFFFSQNLTCRGVKIASGTLETSSRILFRRVLVAKYSLYILDATLSTLRASEQARKNL